MKIIAKVDSTKFLAEVTEHDVALMLGHNSVVGMSQLEKQTVFQVGYELKLTNPLQSSRFIRELDESQIKHIKSSLTSVIQNLDQTQYMISKLTVFEKLKEV